jgi:hypothetical protein
MFSWEGISSSVIARVLPTRGVKMRLLLPVLATIAVQGLAACAETTQPAAITVEIVDGDDQEALIFTSLPEPLRVRVHRAGAPVAGASVQWLASAGTLTPASAVTDAAGMASATWTFGTVPGSFTAGTHQATAAVQGSPAVTFKGHARAGTTLQSLSFTPDEVDVGSGGAQVSVSVHAATDYRSLTEVRVRFASPSRAQTAGHVVLTRTSGTDTDGVWQGSVTIPEGAEPGVWTLSDLRIGSTFGWLLVTESGLQAQGLPYQLTVTAAP